jgi:predicted nucleotidyltransferase component of viral defense system
VTSQFPDSFLTLGDWARTHERTLAEARQRFVQTALLAGLAATTGLRGALVFKGGNALDFVWSPNRSTIDLDFSLDAGALTVESSAESLQPSIVRALQITQSRFGVAVQLHGIRQHPPGSDRSFATLESRIGYALPDEARLRQRMQAGQRSTQVIPVEISLNDSICDTTRIPIGATGAVIRTATIEDIVAEKLRALLQQPIRNRRRSQDALDLAIILADKPELDPIMIGDFLSMKCRARNIEATKQAFRDEAVASYARAEYDQLEATTHRPLPPFDQAWARILAFVDKLDIAENG